jgi:hypothetical protein
LLSIFLYNHFSLFYHGGLSKQLKKYWKITLKENKDWIKKYVGICIGKNSS